MTSRASLLGAALLVSSCTVGTQPGATQKAATVRVLAAASLTQAFQREGAAFAADEPAYKPEFVFGGSASLAQQITDGAPGDVFASADTSSMETAVTAGDVNGRPAFFASNQLEIAVARGNPKHVAGLRDLARPDLVTVLCAPPVPCGKYALQVLNRAGVRARPASLETDVKSVLRKVALGEADAGIVYATDVRAASGTVSGLMIPGADNVVARYPIAALKGAADPGGAAAFIQFVLSSRGRSLLLAAGFGGP